MTVELITAIGREIVLPICGAGLLAWVVYLTSR